MSTRIASPALITVDGLSLNMTTDDGVSWVFDKITGWHDGPSVEVDQVQRIVTHGQFAQPSHRGGRVISVEGTVFADSRGPVAAAADRLPTVLADGGFGEFAFADDDSGTKTAQVQLLSSPSIDWLSSVAFRYQIQFLAPDSYRYGSTVTASTGFAVPAIGAGMVWPAFPDGVMDFGPLGDVGTLSLANAGTAPAPVVFTITGPAPVGGFTIVDLSTGKRQTYLGSLPDGSSLVMDGSDGSVTIDGTADRLGDTIPEAWPMIPAGGEVTFSFEPIGAPTSALLSASCTNTYW